MELRHYTNVLLKWWWLIVAAVVVASVAALLSSLLSPRTYMSQTTLMVGQALQDPNPNQSEFGTAQALALSYTDLVKREPVLRGALEAVGLPWNWAVLQSMVSSRIVPGTLLLEISVLDTDPQRARVLADEVANQLILQSPAGAERDSERVFIQKQIEGLQTKIDNGEQEIRQLDETIASASSARQIQDARSRQQQLQEQISTWQSNYAQLSANLRSGTTNFLSVVEPAQLPTRATGSGTAANILLAAVIGLVLATAAAFALEYLDDSIKSPDEIRKLLNLPTLGNIGQIEGEDNAARLATISQPRSPNAEAYRMLRTNLQFTSIDKPLRTLMITSAAPGEGKSVTAANTAVVMAQGGKRTLLIDADLRRPTQQGLFQLDNETGFTTALLQGDVILSTILHTTSVPNLSIMTSGPLPPDPSEMLGSKRMAHLIESLLEDFDLIVFDSPPAVAVTDASVLATQVDGTLLVIDAAHTRRAAAQRSKEILDAVGGKILGTVFNRAAALHSSYSYYFAEDEKDGDRELTWRRRLPVILQSKLASARSVLAARRRTKSISSQKQTANRQ